ncbi:MAG: hypothetical protein OXC62_17850 [Aestuariivita sp.]|nr:hypothetical protein [Aestuariivita sp.]
MHHNDEPARPTAFSTVDHSDIRGLITTRRHFRRGAASVSSSAGQQASRGCAA